MSMPPCPHGPPWAGAPYEPAMLSSPLLMRLTASRSMVPRLSTSGGAVTERGGPGGGGGGAGKGQGGGIPGPGHPPMGCNPKGNSRGAPVPIWDAIRWRYSSKAACAGFSPAGFSFAMVPPPLSAAKHLAPPDARDGIDDSYCQLRARVRGDNRLFHVIPWLHQRSPLQFGRLAVHNRDSDRCACILVGLLSRVGGHVLNGKLHAASAADNRSSPTACHLFNRLHYDWLFGSLRLLDPDLLFSRFQGEHIGLVSDRQVAPGSLVRGHYEQLLRLFSALPHRGTAGYGPWSAVRHMMGKSHRHLFSSSRLLITMPT